MRVPTATVLILASISAANAAAPRALAPHRAIYDIGLARSDEGSGVSTASGRMVFEITGSACAGYRQRQRMMVNMGDGEGNQNLLDIQFTSFETGSGDSYSFDSRTAVNAETVDEVKGDAHRLPSGVEVDLELPAARTVTLGPKILFPNQHLNAILDAALADRSFVAADIYEGAGAGDASDQATASIGKPLAAGPGGLLRDGLRRWPVSVGYFDRTEVSKKELGEELPSYQMQFTLYENGVTNDLVIDHGDYALSGSLKEIQPLEATGCPSD